MDGVWAVPFIACALRGFWYLLRPIFAPPDRPAAANGAGCPFPPVHFQLSRRGGGKRRSSPFLQRPKLPGPGVSATCGARGSTLVGGSCGGQAAAAMRRRADAASTAGRRCRRRSSGRRAARRGTSRAAGCATYKDGKVTWRWRPPRSAPRLGPIMSAALVCRTQPTGCRPQPARGVSFRGYLGSERGPGC